MKVWPLSKHLNLISLTWMKSVLIKIIKNRNSPQFLFWEAQLSNQNVCPETAALHKQAIAGPTRSKRFVKCQQALGKHNRFQAIYTRKMDNLITNILNWISYIYYKIMYQNLPSEYRSHQNEKRYVIVLRTTNACCSCYNQRSHCN